MPAQSVAQAEEEVKIIPDGVYGHKFGMALTFDVFQPVKPNGAGVLVMVSGVWYSRWTEPQNMLSWKHVCELRGGRLLSEYTAVELRGAGFKLVYCSRIAGDDF